MSKTFWSTRMVLFVVTTIVFLFHLKVEQNKNIESINAIVRIVDILCKRGLEQEAQVKLQEEITDYLDTREKL